ncbi:MAG: hypothetical protein Q4P16_02900 [Spirochaetales bacterium]|nr:hypothetical protein [Spirochaetales bacterium]
MSEEKETESEEKSSKFQSRKFLVWMIWGIITLITAVVVVICCVKKLIEAQTAIELLQAVIQDFFYISLLYLGVNAGQKIGFAVSDAIANKSSNGDER